MESIRIMVEEHTNIRKMLKVIRKISYRVMTNSEYDIDDLPRIIDFVRTYADKHHHGKEEDILFQTMNKEIEKLAKSGAITGMYIEHDMGRLYMANLEKSLEEFKNGNDEARLDIIANAISYTDLLYRHIEKENTAMYKFAENMLNDSSKAFIEDECKKVENSATEARIQEKYITLIEELESKYK
ncbi:hemerythrin [Tissierella sp. P1]|uniref:hemerythrin domain-containing protein n=1 Tax=Tissierella sp. P1 TaxID=1280483 RepID=UPI000BA03175|nr:hemerythrin domain-containing protein [Tissierella sp. P1]OZV10625.1 hemerythrin [Tissierella sp. P1]